MERVMLTLPAELLADIDELARKLGSKRNQVVRQALRDLIERQRQLEFERLLEEGYQDLARQAGAAVEESLAAQGEAAEGIWRWDE